MPPTRFSPKDFFLWLGAMVSLYVSAGALLVLLFNFINILLPDALEARYYDPYSGPIRFAMATLAVVFPIFFYLTRMVHEEIRRTPEKSEYSVRKWLIYLTLFVAGIAIAGDLIALVHVFLNGEITTRFLAKVAVVLIVASGGFWYYLNEIRGRWENQKALSTRIGIGVALTIIGTLVAGFVLAGSPMVARDMRFDEQKVSDLSMLQSQITDYYRAKGEVPTVLREVESNLYNTVPSDPETGDDYGYERTGTTTFSLCATFNRASDSTTRPTSPYMGGGVNERWDHPQGTHCFEREIDPAFFPPLDKDLLQPLSAR